MSVADIKYNELIEDIYNNGIWDKGEKVRTVYEDGSPAYTKSIFGKQVVFEEGEIPLLTTKHVGWKTAFKEMYMFWIEQTVKKEDFDRMNIRIWDEWFLDDGTLGKSYAYQFESRPKKEIVKVEKRIKERHGELKDIVVKEKISPNYSNKDEMVGNIYTNNSGDKCVVLDVFKTGTHYPKSKSVLIQFTKTNHTLILQAGDVRNGNFRDRYSRSVYGVGYLGDYKSVKNIDSDTVKHLKDIWCNILSRCYNKDNKRYKDYGGKGIFVDERWHCLEYFLEDMKYIPQWFLKKHEPTKYHLDKDYYGSNCYSKETCVWITHSDNVLYQKGKGKLFKVSKNGKLLGYYLSTIEASYKLGIDHASIARFLRKERISKDYDFEYVETNNYELYRYKLSRNQLVDLINNLKEFPLSRRHMTSFWNDADVDEKALQECAMQTTWSVRGDKLDLLLYSRSVDTALGLPYNWIQYWFLLQIVAQATGYKAGRFIHQMGNVHYYDRHEELLIKQINSEQYEQPYFEINNKIDDFFQFTLDDININNYVNGGKFEYEVAI